MNPKSTLVLIGDFFFKWRNYVFPVILLILFLGFRPAPGLSAGTSLHVWLALAIIMAGLVVRFATIGWAYIKRGGQDKKVYADTLVTTGYFELCRNPLYVGNLMIYAGTCLLHGNPWVVAGGTAIFLFVYIAIVAAEEHFLRAKFGAEYDAYTARVARWMPALSRHGVATEGMRFSLNRAVTKDYSTIGSTAISVIAVLLIEVFWWNRTGFAHAVWWAAAAAAVLAVCGYAVRSYKLRSGTSV
jgi:protein-S-isoprenylcysteine O-methyltransferase Ste14